MLHFRCAAHSLHLVVQRILMIDSRVPSLLRMIQAEWHNAPRKFMNFAVGSAVTHGTPRWGRYIDALSHLFGRPEEGYSQAAAALVPTADRKDILQWDMLRLALESYTSKVGTDASAHVRKLIR